MTNIEKYNQAFIETFEVSETELNGLNYKSVPRWDSVGHMSLVAAIEEAFDIELSPDDIIDFSSYGKGMEILKRYNVEI